MAKKNIVILGAGFGGLTAALTFAELAQQSGNDFYHVTIIDKSDYQLFTPDLYEIASASKLIETVDELKDAVCINVKLALKRFNIDFVVANIQSVDRAARTVHTTKGDFSYDYALFSLGSVSFDYGIPGIAEHAMGFKSIDEAIEVRRRVFELVDSGKEANVVLCGAGPAGVEVAAEMAVSFSHAVRAGKLNISLVDAGPQVLGMFSARVGRKAQRRLERLGITVRTNSIVKRATEASVTIATGREMPADLIVWTGGIQSNPLTKTLDLPVNKRGQIIVEPTLQCADDERFFAIGDSAQVPIKLAAQNTETDSVAEHDVSEAVVEYAAQTAHEAVEQAKVAAANIVYVAKQQPMERYKALYFIYVITLGGKHGLLLLPYGIIIGGFIAWFVRKFIDFRHFNHVLPFMHACSFWYNGMRTTMKND